MSITTQKIGTLEYLRCDGIAVPHCFTTRLGGVSTGVFDSLNIGMHRGDAGENGFAIPLWLIFLCALVIALGTGIGGKKIIATVGGGIVTLTPRSGFCADLGAAGSLLAASLLGLPVSTTHAKVTAIIGVGAAERPRNVNLRTAGEMVLAWVFTFPGCGVLGFAVAKGLMWVW